MKPRCSAARLPGRLQAEDRVVSLAARPPAIPSKRRARMKRSMTRCEAEQRRAADEVPDPIRLAEPSVEAILLSDLRSHRRPFVATMNLEASCTRGGCSTASLGMGIGRQGSEQLVTRPVVTALRTGAFAIAIVEVAILGDPATCLHACVEGGEGLLLSRGISSMIARRSITSVGASVDSAASHLARASVVASVASMTSRLVRASMASQATRVRVRTSIASMTTRVVARPAPDLADQGVHSDRIVHEPRRRTW
mmetsp:Transcript_137260/g.356642  ORF Transcript_137260/g.356642 Transcript_137260/m.356642 type:complete len:253 (-) Transcript_137260:473-1231(-)